ncbi:hypothetical protein FTX61_06080 [Nitriliruptoraceae bacterium ZYF776]|nr:hypothetical protein [Profundirhabdus halotolerans]
MDSEDGAANAWNVNVPAHVHANWAFTEPGTYELTVEATGTAAAGGSLASDAERYVFHVGDLADYEDPDASDPVETTLTIEGLAHHYHTGDAIELTAVQDPETELDHYHWYTRADASADWSVVSGAGTDTLSLTAGDAPALDGTQVIARLFDDEHEVVAESAPVTIDIDDHDHDHPVETTLTIEGLRHHYHTGDTATLTAVQDPETDLDHYHWFVTPRGGSETVVPGVGGDTYTFTVDPDWDGARVVAKLYDDHHDVVATSEPVTIVVDDHDDDDDPPAAPGFRDVPAGNPHAGAIAELVARGITQGKTPTTFDPSGSVTRAQLATFVARALELPDARVRFSDVPAGYVHAGAIGALVEAGHIRGFDDGTFRPGEPVTRDQIAAILGRVLGLDGHRQDRFSDIAGSVHRPMINALADAGVALGGGDGRYQPRRDLRRDQMASLLVRALDHLDD